MQWPQCQASEGGGGGVKRGYLLHYRVCNVAVNLEPRNSSSLLTSTLATSASVGAHVLSTSWLHLLLCPAA